MTEYRTIMAGTFLLLALAPLTAVWTLLDTVLVALLLGVAGSVLAGYWLREAVREQRFRGEMRALDVRDAKRANRTEIPA